MPKFYVQCGEVARIVQSKDAMSAAIWSAHLELEDRLSEEFWDNTDPPDPETIENDDFIDALSYFAESMSVSEIGFGRNEAGEFATIDVLTEWNQLVIALCRIEDEYLDQQDQIRDITDQM